MRAANVVQLGLKELWRSGRARSLLLLIVFVFTVVRSMRGPRCSAGILHSSPDCDRG